MLETVAGCNLAEDGQGCDMRIFRVAIVGAALLVGAPVVSQGQVSQPFPPQQPPSRRGMGIPPMEPVEPLPPQMREQQAQARNDDRQKKLVADTDKLLVLATELKQDVAKTNKDVLSVDVIKKAEEIEKLAHSVKERMKG